MSTEPAFNAVAAGYDRDFTGSITGRLQRNRVWKYLLQSLPQAPSDILEINCGTGEDALWLASLGHRVQATDISPEMIRVAASKTLPEETGSCTFSVCAFSGLASTFQGHPFSLVFSDFAGINCADSHELQRLDKALADLLKPGGRLVIVVLGKYCLWERMYFLAKGRLNDMKRRRHTSFATLAEGVSQQTWYYDTAELQQLFSSFRLLERRPVGLFLPPSYMEPWAKRHTFVVNTLSNMERTLGGLRWLADYADHAYLVFEKK